MITPTQAARLAAHLEQAPLLTENARSMLGDWRVWARPEQLAPAKLADGRDWRVWLLLAGRGFGKTRSGAEWVRAQAENGAAKRIALVAPTARDARLVMVEGESGLLSIASAEVRPAFAPTTRQLTWPNGAVATLFSADEPDRLRGPQFDAAWCDELAAWRYPAAWDMLMMGLRLGENPRAVVTTTPKPVKLIRALLASPDCVVTRGTTRDNVANLAPGFLTAILQQYEGTRLGRQELDAELLDDMPGALWSRDAIERDRVEAWREGGGPALRRIVVAIDPAASASADADETGIVVAALGQDGAGYVLDDLSGRLSPHDWAARAIDAYRAHRADRIVAEVNNGGAMVEATLRVLDAGISYRPVHASRGKLARAEPVAALYQQGRIHHVGSFPALEDQMCAFTGGPLSHSASPDRVDALVWALSELMLGNAEPGLLSYYRTLSAK
ncbi:MAG TPA: terminase family protein [Stellaceae bacterium]|nr:terminase family protein [Stellaceae bacterium]